MKNLPEIRVVLNGGLGNQMFQYAAARALALRHGYGLAVDAWSGFVRDREFRRHYELHAFPINARKLGPFERLPVWVHKLHQRVSKKENESPVRSHWYGSFINENHRLFPQFEQMRLKGTVWLTGFWQSPQYFETLEEMIRKELSPPPPVRPEARHIGQCMRQEESVAVGIRLYEESANPEKYARTGRLKTPQEIRQIIEAVRSWRPDAKFYVFCTHRAPLLQQLDLPKSTVWLTQEEGFSDSLESLWLMTNCRHHIITNSTFYWWGAWLSGGTHKDADQRIWAADNFANKDAPSTSWELF